MNRSILHATLIVYLALLIVAGTVPTAALGQETRPADHVVVISIDGLLPEYYVRPQAFGLDLPNIRSLLEAGSWAEGVVGQYPSNTYPSHASIVTGVNPARHGIFANRILDPDGTTQNWYRSSSYLQVRTIWEIAKDAGLKTAAVTWPVTVDARIDYLLPETGAPPPGVWWPDQLDRASTPGLARTIFESLDDFDPETPITPELVDRFSTLAATHILRTHRPNLVLVHLFQTDSAQHQYGKHSAEARRAFEVVDDHIGRIIEATEQAGIVEQATFIVTGDHGFREVHSTLQPDVVLKRAGLIETGQDGQILGWQAISHEGAIILKNPADTILAAELRKLFEELAADPYRGVFRLVLEDEIRELGAYPNAAFFIEPAAGYRVRSGLGGGSFVVPSVSRGDHGFLPTEAGIRTGLIMAGAGIRDGIVLPSALQVDIAPTIATLLGLTFAEVDGSPLLSFVEPD